MQQNKIRVVVLMGGDSNEREISLASGRNVTQKLNPHKYEVIPVFVDDKMELYQLTQALLVRNSTKEIAAGLELATKIAWNDLPTIADFVFIGLHGGKGENGAVQGTLEMLGLPYNGSSVFTSSLCMDKYQTAQFLKSNGLHVPEELLVQKTPWDNNKSNLIDTIEQQFTYPLIVKPHDDGCSVFVQKVSNRTQLVEAIEFLFSKNKAAALVEEFIVGMELTVGVIGNNKPEALPPSQAIAQKGILSIEEKFLPGAGENQTPAPLPQETLKLVQRTMEKAYQVLGCKGYARIDCFYQTANQSPTGYERVVILEVNSLPGITPATVIFHQAAEIGMKPMEFIDKIIELGFEEYQNHRAQNEQAIETTSR